ncbi:unnamed protein product [Closterium sp. Naga37s-1]|nr:unnamed protein product [Closterium sp. Naga37s-1]
MASNGAGEAIPEERRPFHKLILAASLPLPPRTHSLLSPTPPTHESNGDREPIPEEDRPFHKLILAASLPLPPRHAPLSPTPHAHPHSPETPPLTLLQATPTPEAAAATEPFHYPRKGSKGFFWGRVLGGGSYGLGRRAVGKGRYGGVGVALPVLFACCGALSFGYHVSIINASLPFLLSVTCHCIPCNSHPMQIPSNPLAVSLSIINASLPFLLADLHQPATSMAASVIVSIPLAVAAVGAPLGGWLADVAGRRRAFQIAALPFIAGSLVSAAASATWHMVIGRALVGVGLGIVSGTVPLYISEVTPTSSRGTWGTLAQLSTSTGVFSALLAGLPLEQHHSWWRGMNLLGSLPPCLLLLGWLLLTHKTAFHRTALLCLQVAWHVSSGLSPSLPLAARHGSGRTRDPPPLPRWMDAAHSQNRTPPHRTVLLFLLLSMQVAWHVPPGLSPSLLGMAPHQRRPPPRPPRWLLLTHKTEFRHTTLQFLQVAWHESPGLSTSLPLAAWLAATHPQNRFPPHCTPMSAGGVACFSWALCLPASCCWAWHWPRQRPPAGSCCVHAAARAAVILRGTEGAEEVLQELTSAQPAALTSAQPPQEPANVAPHEALKPSQPYSSASVLASQSALHQLNEQQQQQTSSPAAAAATAHHATGANTTTLHTPLLSSNDSAPPPAASLFHPKYRRVLLLGSALFALQQFSGINAVVYFSSHVFRSAGFSSGIAVSALIALFKLSAVLLAARLVDSAGRKPLLLLSFLGMIPTNP